MDTMDTKTRHLYTTRTRLNVHGPGLNPSRRSAAAALWGLDHREKSPSRSAFPAAGRTETVARMVVACTITTILVMTFRIPYAFLGIFYAFVISRQKPGWLLRNGFAAVAASATAMVYVA